MTESRHRTTVEVDVDDRAVKQLGQEIDRALDPRNIEAFERALERSNRAIERLTRATEKMGRASEAMARSSASGARSSSQTARQTGFLRQVGATAVGGLISRSLGPRGYAGRAVSAAGGPAGGEGFLPGMFQMIPYAGPVLGAAIQGAQQYYQQHIAVQQARMSAFGGTGIAEPGGRLGRHLMGLGYGPSAQPGVIGQMAQASGRSGDALRQIMTGDQGASSFDRFMGVNPGAIFRGSEVQGDQDDPMGLMTETVASAIEIGFRRTDLNQAVQGLSSVIGELQTSGVQMDPRSLLGFYRGLGQSGAAGLRGEAGASFAQRFTQQAGQTGQGNTSFDYLMLQAAGGGRGGSRSLMGARVFAEQQGGQVFFNLMENLLSRTQTSGDREALGFYLSESMGIPADLAMQLASMDPSTIASMREAAANQNVGRDQLSGFLQDQMGAAAGPRGSTAREAGLEAQRVGIGGRVAESIQRIQDAEINLVQQFMPAALGLVTGTMRAAQELITAFEEGGVAAVLTKISSMMGDMVGAAGGMVGAAAGQTFRAIGNVAEEALGADHPLTEGLRILQDPSTGGLAAPTLGPGGAGAGSAPSAPSTGGGPGTEPGTGLGPLSDARAALREAEAALGRFERMQMGLGDADLEALG